MSKILLHNHQKLGDTLMMTCAVRDLKKAYPDYEIYVDTDYRGVWIGNPHISGFSGDMLDIDEEYNVGPRIVTQGSATNGLHFTNAYRVCLEEKLGKKIKQGLLVPDVYLTEEEKNRRAVEGYYWVINIDCGPYSSKRWRHKWWQEVVDTLSWITFIQVGLSADNEYTLTGKNVINYLGQTTAEYKGIRDLFSLVYHSQGCLGLVSSLPHIAAAFGKPCVVVAGAREPSTFEAYQTQRYIHNIGTLPCAKEKACWRCNLSACKNQVDGVAKCIDMIHPDDVVKGVLSYYEGGLLQKPVGYANVNIGVQPVFRLVCNAHIFGGAERSCIEIVKMMSSRGYKVEVAARRGVNERILREIPFIKETNEITSPCDILMLYASDMIWDFHKEEFNVFYELQAKRKIMALTYKIGKAGEVEWTHNWDKYLFLCSTLRDKFSSRFPKGKTEVIAPPIDLTPFFEVKPRYDNGVNIVRHSSQGENKYSEDMKDIILNTPDVKYSFMPGPVWLHQDSRIRTYPMNSFPVHEFLSSGNCFFYPLPDGYTDQGPRVIMEAMACGLPVLADNRDGAKDRVTEETGWLFDRHSDYIDVINSLSAKELKTKGEAARDRAREEFKKERWVEEIIGG